MERNGTIWDCTLVNEEEYSAQRDCTGRYGTERRDLQNRRVQVRFLSHLPCKLRIYLGCVYMACGLFFACFDPFDPNGSMLRYSSVPQ
jgi:hypothetical protein